MQAVHNITISFSSSYDYNIIYFCTYLRCYFLEAPREYFHLGLVLGLDWASCQLSSACIFFVCPGPPSILLFVPTIHVSHMHPPLTTRQLNTSSPVNNMGMCTSHIQLTHIYTEGIRTQTELSSYLHAALFASLNDKMNNIFGYMKSRYCEGSFYLSPKCSPTGEAKVSHSLWPLP
jgi:hypothetical protein